MTAFCSGEADKPVGQSLAATLATSTPWSRFRHSKWPSSPPVQIARPINRSLSNPDDLFDFTGRRLPNLEGGPEPNLVAPYTLARYHRGCGKVRMTLLQGLLVRGPQ
jgi:hypothetical protein